MLSLKPKTVFKLKDLIVLFVFIKNHYGKLETSGGDPVVFVELQVDQEPQINTVYVDKKEECSIQEVDMYETNYLFTLFKC